MIHALPLITYTIIVWALGSFLAWDITWFLHVDEWDGFGRFMLLLGVFITILPFVVIPCVIVEERKND